MGLIRFLFLLLILYVLWFVAKNYLRKQEMRERARGKPQVARIVRCKQCDIHLPEPEAVHDGDDWFCTPAHKQTWLEHNRRS